MKIKIIFASIISSMAFMTAISRILEIMEFYHGGYNHFFLIWVILTPIWIKLYYGILQNIIMHIYTNPQECTFYQSLHSFETFFHLTLDNYRPRMRRHKFREPLLWFSMKERKFKIKEKLP